MPEGDTIYKVAMYLEPRIVGQTLQSPDTQFPNTVATLAGDRVEAVHAQGKHLVVDTDLRSMTVHLGMRGSWHHYRRGERWKVSPSQARVVLTARCGVLVCFRAPKVTVVLRKDLKRPSAVSHLGPDVLAEHPEFDAIVRRARRFTNNSPSLADMLLDQQIACGIGNAFKSEVLFLERLSPDSSVADVPDTVLLRLYRRARDLMVPNLYGGPRTTTVDVLHGTRPPHVPRYWVYGRRNEPCLRCASPVQRTIMGRHSRVTYWCPTCQPALKARVLDT